MVKGDKPVLMKDAVQPAEMYQWKMTPQPPMKGSTEARKRKLSHDNSSSVKQCMKPLAQMT